MAENWSYISGQYALSTGTDLRDQPLHILYDIAYVFVRQSSIMSKEEHEALEKVDRNIRATHEDFEIGLPSFVRQFKPADEM